ncbi:MAG: AAA family ATPase, partial [Thermomicrobiales bacterium]
MRSISRSDQIRDGVGPNVAPGPGGIPRLPPAPTSLIGRDAEIGEMQAALHDPTIRLVTLLGPGGVGKTRLAVRVAAEMARAGKHRVHFVALAPITDPATIMPTIAGAIGASGPDDEPTIERVADVIGTTDTLLVLDNFERLVDAGPILSELLSLCPGLTLLVTSRAMLRLIG